MTPSHDYILGHLILNPATINKVGLSSAHFPAGNYQLIFKAMVKLRYFDVVDLMNELHWLHENTIIGLCLVACPELTLPTHLGIIKDEYKKANMVRLASNADHLDSDTFKAALLAM